MRFLITCFYETYKAKNTDLFKTADKKAEKSFSMLELNVDDDFYLVLY